MSDAIRIIRTLFELEEDPAKKCMLWQLLRDAEDWERNERTVEAFGAFGRTTDALVEAAEEHERAICQLIGRVDALSDDDNNSGRIVITPQVGPKH